MEVQTSLRNEIQELKSGKTERIEREEASESRWRFNGAQNERANDPVYEEASHGSGTQREQIASRRRRISEKRTERNSQTTLAQAPAMEHREINEKPFEQNAPKEPESNLPQSATPARRRNQQQQPLLQVQEESKGHEDLLTQSSVAIHRSSLRRANKPEEERDNREPKRERANEPLEEEVIKARPSWEQKTFEPHWEEKRRRVDEEIMRRLEEQEIKRNQLQGSIEILQKNKSGLTLTREASVERTLGKSKSKTKIQPSKFAYSPMSTEKSRADQIKGRLKLEKRLRDAKITKINTSQSRSKSPNQKK